MASLKYSAEPLLNLTRIPKKKQVIDFVRAKLEENKSEEAKLLINKILELYETSTGFNISQLSKVRIRRMKAEHYKEMILSLNEELNSILCSHEFKQLDDSQEPESNLYSKISQLTNDLQVHPTYSMIDEAGEIENQISDNNESELLLHLYKTSREFYSNSTPKDKLDNFLKKYDQVFLQSKNNYLRTKYSFVLKSLEQDKLLGCLNTAEAENLYKNYEALLIVETIEEYKFELLLSILRCGVLLPSSVVLLKTYIKQAEDEIENNFSSTYQGFSYLNYFIALYSSKASKPYRLKLLNEYEKSISVDFTAEKAKIKISKGIILLHFSDYNEAKKSFNSAEHLIYKTSWKNIEGRSAWRSICYWRKYIFAEMIFNKDQMYNPAMFYDLEKIINDTSTNRQDSFQIKNEIEGLRDFLCHKWISALEKYESANQYYVAPYYPNDYYFNQAMICIINEKNESKFINKLKASESIFFSTTAIELLKKAKIFYKENKSTDIYEIEDQQQNNYRF